MIVFWGFLAAILSFVFSWWIKGWATKRKIALVDPRDRDLHKKPTPRLGGVAIVGAFLLVCLILVGIYGDQKLMDFGFPYKTLGVAIDKRLLGIILATVFISLIMLIDDLKSLKPFYKLLAQIGSAIILILTGVGLTYLNNPFGLTIHLDNIKIPIQLSGEVFNFVVWADLFLILWVVLLTNATNFIDGLDGLAPTLGLIAFIILGILSVQIGQSSTALLCAIIAGSIIGFLPFNFPPAKMFLGDTGSMFLGLMLATVSVISGGKLATLLMVFALVILDAIYVVVKRILKGKNPLITPDQTHLHHRFLHLGFTPRATLFIITIASTIFGLTALLTYGQTKIYLLGLLGFLVLYSFFYLDFKIKKR